MPDNWLDNLRRPRRTIPRPPRIPADVTATPKPARRPTAREIAAGRPQPSMRAVTDRERTLSAVQAETDRQARATGALALNPVLGPAAVAAQGTTAGAALALPELVRDVQTLRARGARPGAVGKTALDALGALPLVGLATREGRVAGRAAEAANEFAHLPEPPRVFHGTAQYFDHFDPAMRGANTQLDVSRRGYAFSTSPELAHEYADLAAQPVAAADRIAERITALNGELRHAHSVSDNRRAARVGRELEAANAEYEAALRQNGQQIRPARLAMRNPLVVDAQGQGATDALLTDAHDRATAGGHDGIVFRNVLDPADTESKLPPSDVHVAFDRNQIRSPWGDWKTAGVVGDSVVAKGAQAAATARRAAPAITPFAEVPASASRKAVPRPPAVGHLFDAMDGTEAARAARAGAHLVRQPGGGYVGGPAWVRGPGQLGAMRRDVDAQVAEGLFNADWYQRARNVASDGTGYVPGSPAATTEGRMASLYSRGGAAYSPQASPSFEVAAFLKQHNAKVIGGKDVRPKTTAQAENVAGAYVPNAVTGGFDLNPDRIALGRKTGAYADAKDPTVPEASLYRTANDIWHGRVFGYTDSDGGLFSRGFSAQEHNFLIGENVLMADRAQQRGLVPPNAAPGFAWSPRSGQAATWGAARKRQARLDHPEWTEAELDAYASHGVDTATRDHVAHITAEFVPGLATGHLAGFTSLPQAAQDEFSRAMLEATGPRNPIVDALQAYQSPTLTARGQWLNSAGETEHNVADVIRPWVSLENSDLGVTSSGAPKRGGRRLDAPSRALLEFTAGLESALRTQEGVGLNKFTRANSSMHPTELTGARITGAPDAINLAKAQLEADGLDVVNVGDALHVGSFSGRDAKEIQRAVTRAAELTPDLEVQRGRWETGLETTPWGAEGSGQVAKHVVENVLGDPRVLNPSRRLDAAGVPAMVARRAAVEDAFAQTHNLPQRQDIQRLRQIIGRAGFEGLERYTRRFGYAGLPVVGLMAGRGLLSPDP